MNREWRFGVIPWENSLQIESGNKGERFGAAGDERGRESPFLSIMESGVRTRCSLFLCEDTTSEFDPTAAVFTQPKPRNH